MKSWRHKLATKGRVKDRKGIKRQAERESELSPGYVDKFLAGEVDIYDNVAEYWHECYIEELIETPEDESIGEKEFFGAIEELK